MRPILPLLALLLLAACSTPVGPRTSSPEAILNGTEAGPPTGVTRYAESLVGVPYRYGGNSPEQGFDCSGFVSHVYRHAMGIALPRSSIEISRRGKNIDRDELRAGDLVFFNTLHHKFSHVGIYLGGNTFIHSPSQGGSVREDDMGSDYWRKSYNGARRISD